MGKIILDVFDSDFKRVGAINKYSSLIYTEKFNGVGTFQLQASKENMDVIENGRYILIEQEILAEILTLETDSSVGIVSLSGKFIEHILDSRVILEMESFSDTSTNICRSLVNSNFINPTSLDRTIDKIKLSTNTDYIPVNSVISKQISQGSVEGKIQSILSPINCGYSLVPTITAYVDGSNISDLNFRILEGLDRTINNISGNNHVEFSFELLNILESQYTFDKTVYKTDFIVLGEGEGTAKKRYISESGVSGFDRKELSVEDSGIVATDANGNPISDAAYLQLLKTAGEERMEDYKIFESFEVTINPDSSLFTYEEDYSLGDIVTIEDIITGLKYDVVVNEVQKSNGKNGFYIDIVLGYERPLTIQVLKKEGDL
ncbi:siphovirus ReqiPepy6 Gp37-like family protein [Clostridium sp.]|uniref:siphovirus ReqiPepy6 Gp37-like family protein n=1 Tax=Clostridium sp. TaxID=1506 RepID=UPI001A36F7D4|nr:siphovirus ReqiPepy6 Gp37-like family protein [Clostridium sp.]MBK5234052.1 siphovirus ReqiPepy6 Gp37-like family protein [Clostridium sp.]